MAIQKVTLSFINRTDKDKNGNPLVTKTGKPYSRLSIKTIQHGDKYLSGFSDGWNQGWKLGDEVSIDVTQNGQYLNFGKVNMEAVLLDRVNSLEAKMIQVVAEIKRINNKTTSAGTPVPFSEPEPSLPPEDEINPDEIPF